MGEHRYTLEKYGGKNTRFHCPSCRNRRRTFTRYIDNETGEYLHPDVGRCDREIKCRYHYTPKQFSDNNKHPHDSRLQTSIRRQQTAKVQSKAVSFIPDEIFKRSLSCYDSNCFISFLIDLFGEEVAKEVVSRYFIGTSKRWKEATGKGATVFPYIDTKGKVRSCKIMLYDSETGKRIKVPFNHVDWAHSALGLPDFELGLCLFGEHLLKDKSKPVAIVESEKTAVIASIYLPMFIWVAVGGIGHLNAEKCSILKGRDVFLFPDLNGYEKWCAKAKEFAHIVNFSVSSLLERRATGEERKQGLDLADYLMRFDPREFAQMETEATEPTPAVQPLVEVKAIEPPSQESTNIDQRDEYLRAICADLSDGEMHRQLALQMGLNAATCKEIAHIACRLTDKELLERYGKHEIPQPISWEQEIAELENYFSGIAMPAQPVKLNPSTTITDCFKFIESHLTSLKANNGKRIFLPYRSRLQELKQVLSEMSDSYE